jgi:nucleoside-diphosphate-sugar epimerase
VADLWRGTRVLVTGSHGFLGAHVCKTLLDRGAIVIGADQNQESPTLRALGIFHAVARRWRDCTSLGNVLLTLQEERPAIVFHLAGFAHIHPAQQDPVACIDANVMGTAATLEACRQYRDHGGSLNAIVVASSNHVYGPTPGGKLHEWSALEPRDIYGGAKAGQDLIVRAYARSLTLPVVALRHVNAYSHLGADAHIVKATMLALLRGERPVITSDGSPCKGYLYVDDIVAAYLKAAEYVARISGEHEPVFNVSPDAPISVRDLVAAIIEASGFPCAPIVEGSDLTQRGYHEDLDSSLFRALTGWAPQVPLPIGLRWTWDALKAMQEAKD